MRTRREDRSDYDDRPYWNYDDEHEEELRRRFIHDEVERLREARMLDDERRYREERMFERDRFERDWDDERRERYFDDRRERFEDPRDRFADERRERFVDDRQRYFADRERRMHEPRESRGRGYIGHRERGPHPYDHADERDRWMYARRDADWRARYASDRYPSGNPYDQRLAYDRERERFERYRDDRYRFGDRDYMFDRDTESLPRPRRYDPFEHDDIRRGISRFHDRDRRR
jgi:hypothetical protein